MDIRKFQMKFGELDPGNSSSEFRGVDPPGSQPAAQPASQPGLAIFS